MKLLFLLLNITIGSIVFAQDSSNTIIPKLPGDTTLVSTKEELLKIIAQDNGKYKYTVENYFSKPQQSSFEFSPNGIYFSYREKDKNGKRHIYVKNTKTNEIKRVIEEKDELIRGYDWVTDNRLVYFKDKGGNENYQLFAIDVTGKNEKALTHTMV